MGAIEVCSEKPTRLVFEERIHADHEVAVPVSGDVVSAQVLADDLVGDRNERLVEANAALDLRFAADLGNPFVRTGRRITGSTALCILPSNREDVETAREELAKERDLLR